jgi:cation transport protein ChaC
MLLTTFDSTIKNMAKISADKTNDVDSIWVFGYGSLIWRADFDYAEVQPGYIKHFSRRFWQGSPDHRGTPQSPGRVVTLIEQADAICWGNAYRLNQASATQTLKHLDHREKGGYDRRVLPIHLKSGEKIQGLTYHATQDNESYLGEATTVEIAKQVIKSLGPSGDNIEYVLNLEKALADISTTDDHVTDIAKEIRALLKR